MRFSLLYLGPGIEMVWHEMEETTCMIEWLEDALLPVTRAGSQCAQCQ